MGPFLFKEGRVLVYKLASSGGQLALHGAGTALSSRRLQNLHARALKR
jgi:hypothetical protein